MVLLTITNELQHIRDDYCPDHKCAQIFFMHKTSVPDPLFWIQFLKEKTNKTGFNKLFNKKRQNKIKMSLSAFISVLFDAKRGGTGKFATAIYKELLRILSLKKRQEYKNLMLRHLVRFCEVDRPQNFLLPLYTLCDQFGIQRIFSGLYHANISVRSHDSKNLKNIKNECHMKILKCYYQHKLTSNRGFKIKTHS